MGAEYLGRLAVLELQQRFQILEDTGGLAIGDNGGSSILVYLSLSSRVDCSVPRTAFEVRLKTLRRRAIPLCCEVVE